MKYLLVPLLLVLFSCGTTRIAANVGQVERNKDLKPTHSETAIGLEVSDAPEEGGLGFELGARYGTDTGNVGGADRASESWEVYVGPRYEWRFAAFSPFISAGASVLGLHGSFFNLGSTTPDRDVDIGYYAGGGVDLEISENWMIGLALRRTFDHELLLSNVKGDADSWQYLVRCGYSF